MSKSEVRDEAEFEAFSQLATHDPLGTFDPMRRSLEFADSSPIPSICEADETASQGSLPTTNRLRQNRKPDSSSVWKKRIQDRAGGRFQLHKVIGRGGFGEVWEAKQNSLSRVVAVKALRRDRMERYSEDSSKAEVLSMFLSEAQTAAALDHPNILPIYDLGTDGGEEPMIAMKRVRGNPWDDLIYQDRAELPYDEFLEKHLSILEDVCQAVAFAHSRGVLHRDLKAEQVMVGRFGEVLLMDWGLAVVFDNEILNGVQSGTVIEWGTPITSASNPAGTPAFMAPEQTDLIPEYLGPWTDVYLLAGILYQVISGDYPHPGPGSQESFRQARRGYVRPLSEFLKKEATPDQDLIAITERALSKSPKDRPQNAEEFLNQIQEYRRGANRKRQARELVAEAEGQLQKATRYDQYNDAVAKLERAMLLWPGHPDATKTRQTALEKYTSSAIVNGDLVLARLLTDRLEPDDRKELVVQIESEEEALEQRERTRRRASILVRALAAMLLIGAVTSVYIMNGLLQDAKRSQQLTEEAQFATNQGRLDAARFINYFAVTLVPRVNGLNDTKFEQEVLDHAIEYFDKIPEQFISVNDARAHFYALLYTTRMHMESDLPELAKTFLAEAKVIFYEKYKPLTVESGRFIRGSAYDESQLLLVEGRLEAAMGNNMAAVPFYEKALEIARVNTQERPENSPLWSIQAEILIDLFKALYEEGQINVEYFKEALSTIDAGQQLHPDSWFLNYSKATLFQERGNLSSGERARNDYELSYNILEPLVRQYPERKKIKAKLMFAVAEIAQNYALSDDLELSLPFFEKAGLWVEEVPSNLTLGYYGINLTVFYSIWGEALIRTDRHESAKPKLEAVVKTYAAGYEAGDRRDLIANNYSWNLYLYATAIDPDWNAPESRELLVKAETVLQPYMTTDANTMIKATNVFIQNALGNMDEARIYAEELNDLGFNYEGFREVLDNLGIEPKADQE